MNTTGTFNVTVTAVNSVSAMLVPGTPVIGGVAPAVASLGQNVTVTVNGTSTNFAQGVTQFNAGPGITVGTITVTSPTSMTVGLTVAANAATGPRTLIAVTGAEQAVLPNGLTIQ